jgi:hypothetical protein
MSRGSPNPASILLIEEYFASQDERFLTALCQFEDWKPLGAFAPRWIADHRPWARAQLFEYLSRPLNHRGHQSLVKRLFKTAEEKQDDELMAAFLVAFDRFVRHKRRTRWNYDWQTRRSQQSEELSLKYPATPPAQPQQFTNSFTRERYTYQAPNRPNQRLYKHKTRYYLRRRAWRYFRWMAYKRPDDYCKAITQALIAYRDEDLAHAEDLFDSWGLMRACYGESKQIEHSTAHHWLAEGVSMGELRPAPFRSKHWKNEAGYHRLITLLQSAQSRFVRLWAMQLLDAAHADRLATSGASLLLGLISHSDEEISSFAAKHLQNSPHLQNLPLDDWLKMLQSPHHATLSFVCDAMQKHVRADRLSLAECIRLACAAPVPVSKLGLAWLKTRTIAAPADRALLTKCGQTQCAATAGELAAWALSHFTSLHFNSPANYDREVVTALLDSQHKEARAVAIEWLTAPDSPGGGDSATWARLVETPYDDVRFPLLAALERKSAGESNGQAGISVDAIAPVWSTVLLGVHRGGRAKLKAISQLKHALLKSPDRLPQLLPVLRAAARSVRKPESAAALAAICELAVEQPQSAGTIYGELPEIAWQSEVGTWK